MSRPVVFATLFALTCLFCPNRSDSWGGPIEASGMVEIAGQVQFPGLVGIPKGTPIADLLKRVGGSPTQVLGIEVLRRVGRTRDKVALRFNLSLSAAKSQPVAAFKIYAGDRLQIGEAFKSGDETPSDLCPGGEGANVDLIGAVWNPGKYRLAPGTKLRLALAIAAPWPVAHLGRIQIERAGWHRNVNAGMPEGDEFVIEPGDRITVPETMR